MTLKKCDRCGALYEFTPGCKKDFKYRVQEKSPEKLSNVKVIDLCPACYEGLAKWIENREG